MAGVKSDTFPSLIFNLRGFTDFVALNSCNDDVSSYLIDHHLSRGSASERELISGLLVITEEQMENMTAFPALITLYSGKVLPSFENLPVSETSRYGEHMLLILLLLRVLQTFAGLLLPNFF